VNARKSTDKSFSIGEKIMSKIQLISLAFLVALGACSEKSAPESEVYTLYSTNYPQSSSHSGVATFDLSNELFNRAMCEEVAEFYSADFEKLRASTQYDGTTKMRYWCQKGRYKQ
jgi:hypothetical protein